MAVMLWQSVHKYLLLVIINVNLPFLLLEVSNSTWAVAANPWKACCNLSWLVFREVLDSEIEGNYLKNCRNGGKGPSTDQSSSWRRF